MAEEAVQRRGAEAQRIEKGIWLLWGLAPAPRLPNIDIFQEANTLAIAVDNHGQTFIVSKNQTHWRLIPVFITSESETVERRAAFDEPSYEFPLKEFPVFTYVR